MSIYLDANQYLALRLKKFGRTVTANAAPFHPLHKIRHSK
jgi:hypothetical protein